jgi:hypothetical protein
MNNLPPPQDGDFLRNHAQLLAAFIDTKAEGHPLVSGMPEKVAAGILWQYSSHDFIIYAGGRAKKFPTPSQLGKGSSSIIVLSSFEEGLEFIRLTESIRQCTEYPHIHFGRMPGTIFK